MRADYYCSKCFKDVVHVLSGNVGGVVSVSVMMPSRTILEISCASLELKCIAAHQLPTSPQQTD